MLTAVSDDARAESPAANYLFNIDNDAELLNQNDNILYFKKINDISPYI